MPYSIDCEISKKQQNPVSRVLKLCIAFSVVCATSLIILISSDLSLSLHSTDSKVQHIIVSLILASFSVLIYMIFRSAKINEARLTELAQSQHKYQKLFSSITDAVLIFCPQTGVIIDCNLAAERLFELEKHQLCDQEIYSLMEDQDQLRQHVQENSDELSKRILSATINNPNCKHVDVEISTGVFDFPHEQLNQDQVAVAIIRNISVRKKLETRLQQSERMQSIGKLAGGVAHDFRNQLTVVTGYCDLLKFDLKDQPEIYESIEQIRQAADRATNITQQLLAFSRKQTLNPEILNIGSVLGLLRKPLTRIIGEQIQINYNVCDKAYVKVDRTQFEQAIFNIAINARDAMPDGGRIDISLKVINLSKSDAMNFPDMKAGKYAVLDMQDSGIGMPPEIAARVFEPFFTAKKGNRGTGLGLATVYGFVAQSNGHIEAKSRPGKGTKFRMFLPALSDDIGTQFDESQQAQKPAGGSEIILLTEDDDAVRHLVAKVLHNCGYTVLQASNPQEAIPLGEHYEAQIDLLISDVIMPRMNGAELADRLKKARPNMEVLFISGYSGKALEKCKLEITQDNFLAKPFNPNDLATTVRKLLDKKKLADSPSDFQALN